MADIRGNAAAEYLQFVQGPTNTAEFELSNEVAGVTPEFPNSPAGYKSFLELADTDTIIYEARSMTDPTVYEIGVGTYDATNKQLDRTDANVLDSSNSLIRVDFSGEGTIKLAGVAGVGEAQFLITNYTGDLQMDVNTATSRKLADVMATLIKDLKSAGILPGATVS